MNGKPTTNKAGVVNKGQPVKNGLLIRDACSEELNEVSLLIKEAYMEYRRSFPPEHWKFYLENIIDVHSRLGVSELIVAELDRKLVGVVTLYLDASSSSQEQWPKGWAGVRLLAVRPAYRGQGIGRALMEECIYRCRKQNIKAIGLHTAIIMSVARKMYEDMGFIRAPEYDFQPRPGTVIMAYRLRL
jgi:GNAT superfamily N-acetyltransferase